MTLKAGTGSESSLLPARLAREDQLQVHQVQGQEQAEVRTEVAVKRDTLRGGSRTRHGHRHSENRIRAQFALKSEPPT